VPLPAAARTLASARWRVQLRLPRAAYDGSAGAAPAGNAPGGAGDLAVAFGGLGATGQGGGGTGLTARAATAMLLPLLLSAVRIDTQPAPPRDMVVSLHLYGRALAWLGWHGSDHRGGRGCRWAHSSPLLRVALASTDGPAPAAPLPWGMRAATVSNGVEDEDVEDDRDDVQAAYEPAHELVQLRLERTVVAAVTSRDWPASTLAAHVVVGAAAMDALDRRTGAWRPLSAVAGMGIAVTLPGPSVDVCVDTWQVQARPGCDAQVGIVANARGCAAPADESGARAGGGGGGSGHAGGGCTGGR
jgi:hypothetical protein